MFALSVRPFYLHTQAGTLFVPSLWTRINTFSLAAQNKLEFFMVAFCLLFVTY